MAATNVRGGQVADNTIVLDPGVGQDVIGVLPVANGGTGDATLLLNALLVGNGTGAVLVVAPGANGTVLTSNGTSWSAVAASSGGVPTIINAGETFTVTARNQSLFSAGITVNGTVAINGCLQGVR